MKTFIYWFRNACIILFIASQITFSQSNWIVEEETNIEGMVSGTIQMGHIFETTSGNIYEVTGLTLQLVLELSPKVLVLKNGASYKLVVEGFDEPVICSRLKTSTVNKKGRPSQGSEVIESRIDGEFEGWEGETIFKLDNGQIWQQSAYAYTYHYAYRPEVLIYKSGGVYKMKVEDVEETITVERLK
jgi:hypothetical protein